MAKSLLAFFLMASLPIQTWPQEPNPEYDPNHYRPASSPCFDSVGAPQRCVPDFINAAFNLHVDATDECGRDSAIQFCLQTGHQGIKKVCEECDSRIPEYAHPASYLTDFNNPNSETWWQSNTMAQGLQYPNSVNLTIKLGKSFDITYVRLKFVSPRPESFVIYKKTYRDSEWEPWQYYSGSCRTTFGLPDKAPILPGNEAIAQCTREFSDISPLTGGNIAFSTLEGRPSAEAFEESEILHEFVTATEIKISLVRINTYGDEIFRDPRVLRSYFYAISDFAVGGRCKCNGHASECTRSTGQGAAEQLVCNCKHNTTGTDCGDCEPFFKDRPWRAATSSEANECLPCQCNGLSRRCYFDQKMFDETGSGGVCVDCAGNTRGPHCEVCDENHWRRPRESHCTPCQCSEIGSESGQCDENGQCKCKPGVTGQFCDRCSDGFFSFSESGCQDCQCEVAGSINNNPRCRPDNGQCECKPNVEGTRCNICKPGTFNIALSNDQGCTPCFCYVHSSICSSAEGFYAYNESSLFKEGVEQFTGGSDARPVDVQWAQLDKAVAVSQSQSDNYPVYFFTPKKYIGDQRFAYNQFISFTFRVQAMEPSRPSARDIVLIGANGQELALAINTQNNSAPVQTEQNYRFKIQANPSYQWNPRLQEVDFIKILSNLTAIKIRGTYSPGDVGFISNFQIGSAGLVVPEGAEARPADWVETCQCSDEYTGQYCESCSSGYKRVVPFGGPLSKCIPCQCNNHSESCDSESGVCICQHNTAGDNCQECIRGYYGDALSGGDGVCKKCDCPENGPCVLLEDGDTMCTECVIGYTGRKCDICAEDYFGDPANGIECKKCECNENVDSNSIGNCDATTGECRKCVFKTTGFHCEKCKPGYWGDAESEIKPSCDECRCYAPGTRRPTADYEYLECNQENGQCDCQPNVIGQHCDRCQEGYFNLTSGSGCEDCSCNTIGSTNTTCDVVTGNCQCKPGVVGRQCDMCAPYHFGFSSSGCERCDCDQFGSDSTSECDINTGQCLCKDNVEGRRCDQCSENRFDLRRGCLACDDCYTLIQTRKNDINQSIGTLRENLNEIQNNPVKVEDTEFDGRVQEVGGIVKELHSKALEKLDTEDSKMIVKVNEVKDRVSEARKKIKDIDAKMVQIDDKAAFVALEDQRVKSDRESIERELDRAIEYASREGKQHLQNAQNAANRLGDSSQQLSELAEESSKLITRQEEQRSEIEKFAEAAAANSKAALSEANEAIYGASTTSQQIATLEEQLKQTSNAFEQIKQNAEQVNTEAKNAHDAAALALSNVEGAKFPDVVPEDLNEEGQNQREESSLSATDANEKIEENRASLEEARSSLNGAAEDLRAAKDQQELATNALRDVEAARNRSNDAFDLATKTWNEAQASLDSLNDFNENIDSRKEEALKQLEKLGDIQQQINEAREATAGAEADIGNAKTEAEKAQKLAEKAKEDAEIISKQTTTLKNDTSFTKDDAEKQKVELDSLNEVATSLESTTNDFENQANTDAEKSAEILRKAILSDTNAKQLQSRLNESETQLTHALTLLNSLEDVNDDQLTELESLLNDAEKRYAEAALDKLVKEEVVRKTEQDRTQLKREVDSLNKQLENLRSIYEALPTRCYNLVNLEQEGQK